MKRGFQSIVIAVLLVNSGIAGILLWLEMQDEPPPPARAAVTQPKRAKRVVKHRPKRRASRTAPRQAKRMGLWDTATEAEIAAAREREQWAFRPPGKCGSRFKHMEGPAMSEVCCYLNCGEAHRGHKVREERCDMKCLRYHDHKTWQWVQDTAEKT